VVAGAVILNVRSLPPDLPASIDDSKKLSAIRRLEVFQRLGACAVIGVGMAGVDEIDTVNILGATHLAMARAVDALATRPDVALVDGNRAPRLSCRAHCLIGGDALSLSIAAASIVAKVTRDRIMSDLAKIFPGYGWEHNAGYGTPYHRGALERLGVTPHHRRSFQPVAHMLSQHRE
jgi:ribonuclease HII